MRYSFKGTLEDFLSYIDEIEGVDVYTAFASLWHGRESPVELYEGERLVASGRKGQSGPLQMTCLDYCFLHELKEGPMSIDAFIAKHQLAPSAEHTQQMGERLRQLAEIGIVTHAREQESLAPSKTPYALGDTRRFTVNYREQDISSTELAKIQYT